MVSNYLRYIHITAKPDGSVAIMIDVLMPDTVLAKVRGLSGKYAGAACTPVLLQMMAAEIAECLYEFEQKGGKLELRPKGTAEALDSSPAVQTTLTPSRLFMLVVELCQRKFGADRKPKLVTYNPEMDRWFVKAVAEFSPEGPKPIQPPVMAWAAAPFEVVLAVLRQWVAEELILTGVPFRRTHSMSVVSDYGDPEFLLAAYFWAVSE